MTDMLVLYHNHQKSDDWRLASLVARGVETPDFVEESEDNQKAREQSRAFVHWAVVKRFVTGVRIPGSASIIQAQLARQSFHAHVCPRLIHALAELVEAGER